MAGGNTFAVLQGIGYWAPLGTLIPGPHLAYGDAMPTGWNPIVDTVNGYQVTYRNPRAAITSEERGRIGQVAAGDEGVACALQYRSIDFDLLKLISALQSRTLAARTQVETVTISGTSTAGTVLVNPGGLATPVPITVGAAGTSTAAATAIAAGTYTGWTAAAVGSVVTFTASSTGYKGQPSVVNGTSTGLTFTTAVTTSGMNTTEVAELDKNVPMGFMLSIEGIATAGSFFTNRRWIRYVFYNVENTANADHILRHSGADAAFAPSATLEGLPVVSYTSTMLEGSGLTSADLDKNKRSNIFYIDAPQV